MLESLTDRIGSALRSLSGQSKLTETNMADALKEVRTALLAADVHFKVARNFVNEVKEACIGQEVLKSVSPGQMVVKIINDELVKLLGDGARELDPARPLRILMVGLHGAGKTTSTAKLGRLLKKQGIAPMVVGCDIYRPAAIDQLETLARQEELAFFADRSLKDVPKIGKRALDAAKKEDVQAILFDTAGRLQIDEDLIEEVKKLRKTVNPHEVFLVADSALGQEAVNVAKAFHEAVELTGIVLTKMDGDARGGAALSMKSVTGVPIRYLGTGEKPGDFELFHPDRLASRILGMGDVVSLVEKAQEEIDVSEAERLAERMQRNEFTFEDMLAQFRQMKKLGSLGSVMNMLPGMNNVQVGDDEEKKMKRTEALILSMTPLERQRPQIINGSRRVRIAKGAGMEVKDLNALIKQYGQMRKMMKMMKGGKGKRLMKQMKESGGLPPMASMR